MKYALFLVKINTIILFFFLILLISCKRIEENGNKLIDKSEEALKDGWSSAVDKLFEETTIENTSFEKIFNPSDSLNIKDINGLKINLPIAFYYTFLKYKADKIEILNFIENLPTKRISISDSTYHKTDEIKLFDNLSTIEKNYSDIKPKLDFFLEIKHKKGLEFYQCTKYPNAHYLAFDSENEIVYHHFEKIWD